MSTKGNTITDIDLEVLQAFAHHPSVLEAAKSICMSKTAFRYHLQKIQRITGLNPYIFCDMVKLHQKFFAEDATI